VFFSTEKKFLCKFSHFAQKFRRAAEPRRKKTAIATKTKTKREKEHTDCFLLGTQKMRIASCDRKYVEKASSHRTRSKGKARNIENSECPSSRPFRSSDYIKMIAITFSIHMH